MNANGDHTNYLQQRFLETSAQLKQAAERLHMARRGVLSGAYNPQELGEALQAYRQAEVQAQSAREAWGRWEATRTMLEVEEPAPAPSPEPPSPSPEPPSPRLLFARWLVQTGRLSG